jgi:hypothetical protein
MPVTLLLLAAVGYGLAAIAYLGLSGLIVASGGGDLRAACSCSPRG